MTVLIASLGLLLRVEPAGASPEITHSQIDETEVGVDDFCGLTVDTLSTGTITTQLAENFQAEVHLVQAITNEANGEVVYVETSNHQRFEDLGPNEDGTTTFVQTYEGVNSRIYTDHSSVLLTVAGSVSLTVTVDQDDHVVDIELVTHGRYDDREACDVIGAAIG